MLTIKNIDTIVNVGSSINNWRISAVNEMHDLYGFEVSIGNIGITFYLNRESTYISGRNEPVYRLYKDFDQSKINRWLSFHQITPYFIGELIDKMLNE
jgi:hypothetical protein